jgi:hypothetical protein
MPRKRRTAKARIGVLTWDQQLELWLGPNGESCFVTDAERRRAWAAQREEILADCPACVRPWAFWEYEVKHHPTGGVSDREELTRLGLLSPDEVALTAKWDAVRARAAVTPS